MKEWMPVNGYVGIYEISINGEVKSLSRTINNNGVNQKIKERILKPSINNAGYLIVGLNKNGKGKTFCIHRLIAEHFIPNPKNKHEVNHKNENKLDNRVCNLEWITAKENANYGKRNLNISKSNKGRKNSYLKRPVLQLELNGKVIKKWNSIIDVQKSLGYNNSNITNCCKGRAETAYGYRWNYINR